MKKIFFSLLAIAALAACSKSNVAYEQTDEIGFQVVNGKMTKAAVQSTAYPTTLDMFVFAMTETTDGPNADADFLDKALFKHSSNNLWAGSPQPHYWPNVKNLYFAGVSKSGNVTNDENAEVGVPTYEDGVITIEGYTPGVGEGEGVNDLMWFPTTDDSYGKAKKNTDNVPAVMKHACSWITVMLGGNNHTAGKYTVTDIHIEGLTTRGKAVLGDEANWTLSTEDADMDNTFSVFTESKVLPSTPTAEGYETFANNTVVLPNQIPGDLYITYSFKSQAGEDIVETVTGSLKFNGDEKWQPGVHYTYTVTITADQILIAPTVDGWDASPVEGAHGVTVY